MLAVLSRAVTGASAPAKVVEQALQCIGRSASAACAAAHPTNFSTINAAEVCSSTVIPLVGPRLNAVINVGIDWGIFPLTEHAACGCPVVIMRLSLPSTSPSLPNQQLLHELVQLMMKLALKSDLDNRVRVNAGLSLRACVCPPCSLESYPSDPSTLRAQCQSFSINRRRWVRLGCLER